MSLSFSRRGEKLWLARGFQSVVLFLFFLFNTLPAANVDVNYFFGADGNKIRETRGGACEGDLTIPKPSAPTKTNIKPVLRVRSKYLKICHKSEKKLDKCIKSSLEKFLENVKSDPEELNLPNLDPIEIPLLEFQLGSGNVSLHITFKDFKISGFKNFRVMNVKSNLIDNKFEIAVENPLMVMAAQYSAEGGVFTFPISARGDFYLNLTDVSAVLIFRLTTETLSPGLSFFVVEDSLMDLLSSGIEAHFGEVIDGSNAIGTAFNSFFNNNAHEIFTLIKPNLSGTLANIFGSIANQILSRHPDSVLLPD